MGLITMIATIANHPSEKVAQIIGGRWRGLLVHYLLNGPKRFTELQKEIEISRKMLTVNLRVLEEAGLPDSFLERLILKSHQGVSMGCAGRHGALTFPQNLLRHL